MKALVKSPCLLAMAVAATVHLASPFQAARLQNSRSRCCFATTDDETIASTATATTSTAASTRTIKEELLQLGRDTARGFRATPAQRSQVMEKIYALAAQSPTVHPAAAYHTPQDKSYTATLAGKWTLVYTDAPDIIGLENSNENLNNPFVKLGRIGQDCSRPPIITNVIEWTPPPFLSSIAIYDRVLQKVVCQGNAVSSSLVKLQLTGFDIQPGTPQFSWLDNLPVRPLQFPQPLVFGQFEILYLDNDLRITRTGQNKVAVNTRMEVGSDKEWF